MLDGMGSGLEEGRRVGEGEPGETRVGMALGRSPWFLFLEMVLKESSRDESVEREESFPLGFVSTRLRGPGVPDSNFNRGINGWDELIADEEGSSSDSKASEGGRQREVKEAKPGNDPTLRKTLRRGLGEILCFIASEHLCARRPLPSYEGFESQIPRRISSVPCFQL